MKQIILFLFMSVVFKCISQEKQLQLVDRYWEDQLYLGVTYNILDRQPLGVSDSGFSYGLSGGYIKDIPFNRKGRFAIGIGLGYSFDSFNHGYKILIINDKIIFDIDNIRLSNELKLHNIEFPLEFRFRTSTVKDYRFWRVYGGAKISYNFSNSFGYEEAGEILTFKDVSRYNKWQIGLSLSTGYGAFNFYMYYGITPMFKRAIVGAKNINTRVMKFGLIFYIL
ncbi:conserved hypothetical protein [Tenacibaculum maritimum]|uniref:porin family protein n=1 Tax=Tenacibaculum maritimum TaxID=107401 RepID=UPI0012E54D96|nr:porin family protein [Tenacibaculum maritimum]CAA0246931.1 conserved hypothetical protein [Tenacibaculum maritimum]